MATSMLREGSWTIAISGWLPGPKKVRLAAAPKSFGMITASGALPATSVAKPTGELHDVEGVWIGDTSAFPTPSGANPMLTCMALAHRTAEFISGQRDESAGAVRAAAAPAV